MAALLRRYGIEVDPQRLEERAAADRSRKKLESDAGVQHYRDLGAAVKRARRACEVAEMMWRMNPNSDTLAEARQAQQHRNELTAELREACLQDQDLMSALMR